MEREYWPLLLPVHEGSASVLICPDCGAMVGDTVTHDAWHDRQAKTAIMADRADSMTRPIGG